MKKIVDSLMQAGLPTSNRDWGNIPYILTFIAYCLWPLPWIYSNQNKISFAQSTMARGLTGTILSYIICSYTKQQNIFKFKNNIKILTVRSIVMTIHSFYIGLSQFMLPLPVTHTISCSGTIFIFIIDYFMNGTVINKTQLLGIIVGLVGVLLTSNGRVLTQLIDPTYKQQTNFKNYLTDNSLYITLFTLGFIVVQVLWAYGVVITRLTKANTFQLNFLLGISFYFLGCLILPFMQQLGYQLCSFEKLFKLFLFTGLPLYIVQIFVITSLTMTKQTGILNIVSFSAVFVSYIISIFKYNETPNLLSLIGIILVLFGVVRTVLNVNKK